MAKIKKEILCTLGPSSCNRFVIQRLNDLDVTLFRINLSHTKLSDIDKVIDEIQQCTSVPICLDTEGAQVRTGDLKEGKIFVEANQIIRIVNKPLAGTEEQFNFYPNFMVDQLEVGEMVSIDFNSVLVQVIDKDWGGVTVRVITGGALGENKAVSFERTVRMSPLTEKDVTIIKQIYKWNIKHVALSFANRVEDVRFLRSLVGEDVHLISKIESLNGLDNVESIAQASDAVLIDRGDLSREVPIEQIPRVQKEIIRRAKDQGVHIYVATNLLESMITMPSPTRAEVNDIFNTLKDGADGLVLAAETAIGKYPVQCAMMVKKVISEFVKFDQGETLNERKLPSNNSLLLTEPHGGQLIDRIDPDPDWDHVITLPKINVDRLALINAEQIAVGTYSPLTGFMNKKELESVLQEKRLPNGVVWPLPITLQVDPKDINNIDKGNEVVLCDSKTKEMIAILEIEDIFMFDLEMIASKMFATTERQHPGVHQLFSRSNQFLGGPIRLLKRLQSADKHFEITPRQTRRIFENKGWCRVVGFHTRNAPHRVHEFIQLKAFEKYHCDGLFIHPLTGPKKQGDYTAQIILKSYEILINKFYPKDKVLLAALQSYPRYAGPIEAVFTAICRKNFGCSHFIIGRDHSGVGGYYDKDAAYRLFEELGPIGIEPIYFNEYGYSPISQSYLDVSRNNSNELLNISGTEARKMLQNKTVLPDWFMRPDIAALIIEEMKNGKEVFTE
jgi:pyruvate kinase